MPKILVVDDEPRIAEIMENFLVKSGFEVVKVIGGEEAIKILHSDIKIDFMLLDMKMPKVNGMAVINKMRELNKKILTVILTGSFDAIKYFEELREIGFTEEDVLCKPVDLLVLLDKVKKKLQIT